MRCLYKKVITFYHSINLVTKSLLIIGMISLIETVVSVFFDANQTSPNDIAIRSVMSSIFGFVFGTQLSENSNIENSHSQTLITIVVALICLLTLIIGHWIHVNQNGAASVEIRNLLFSAVGFLLSRARHSN